jgi:U4/U6.U5 tri-snRNP-associated protein 1
MAETLGLDEANRIRVAMGLKPIPVPGATGPVFQDASTADASDEPQDSTLETRTAAAEGNWMKLQEEAEAKKKRQEKKERIKKERDAAARSAKLVGKGLAEVDDDLDTASWIKGHNKRIKQREKEHKLVAEREAQKKRAEYTATDLAGVKVGHELDQFDAGSEQILTLKDAEIGEESEEDELEAVELRDKERTQKRVEAKKNKLVYNPNEVDETGENAVLAKYDEEIDGVKRHRFTLDGQGSTKERVRQEREQDQDKAKRVLINLDMLKDDAPISDYKDISEIKIRKPKKKKVKTTRKKAANDDDDDTFPNPEDATNPDAMDIDSHVPDVSGTSRKKRARDDAEPDDDEDLQSQLARQRREALKKRKRVRPEDLARQMKEEKETTMDGIVETVQEDEGGLVIDATSVFVEQMRRGDDDDGGRNKRRRKSSEAEARTPAGQPPSPNADVESDVDMEESYGALEEAEEAAERAKREGSSSALDEVVGTGLEEATHLSTGIGATLNMLRQRALLEGADESLHSNYRDRQKFLAERRHREEEAEREARMQREKDRASGRLDGMTAREREEYARQNNINREQVEARKLAKMFNDEYKPKVELNYIDDFGRSMNQKEAFKHLSHQFHGKTSGNQKTEKRLKKIENEKKRLAAGSGQVQGAASAAMGDRAKASKQAGVRLS